MFMPMNPRTRFLLVLAALGACPAGAAPLKSANVTKVVNEVTLYGPSASGRAAVTGDQVSGESSVHTGRKSRAELTFADQTVTRIGSNSIFSFQSGSRDMEIKQGSFLLQVPKNAGGATIRTSTVVASITGTTTMMEYSEGNWVKFITLEGDATLKLRDGKTVVVSPGQMIVMRPGANRFPKPMIVNVRKLVSTSALMQKSDFGKLSAKAEDLIGETGNVQTRKMQQGALVDSGFTVEGANVSQTNPRTTGVSGILSSMKTPFPQAPQGLPLPPPLDP